MLMNIACTAVGSFIGGYIVLRWILRPAFLKKLDERMKEWRP